MSYISHEDYKNLMDKFQAETPKGMLKESLDPVGKEDDDIDNDGDVDKTDKYLSKRRQAVGKAITGGRKERNEGEVEEETKVASDGSHMKDPAFAAKVVAEKHGKELQDLIDIYDAADSSVDYKVKSKAWKDFENAAISWCGHEMLEAGVKRVAVQNLLSGFGYFEDWVPDYLDSLKQELRKVAEGLHMPPLQAVDETSITSEDQAPFGMSVLSPDERKQLKEYITSIKTIKEEISKLVGKTGKKLKEGDLGGDRTGLVMTKAEMWEGGNSMEQIMDVKLKEAFEKVTGMIMQELLDDGFEPGDVKLYLDHIIEEKAREAAMGQYDPH